jgi:hypothetical protein
MTTTPTIKDYNNLLRKVHTLEGILATTQYRNHQLQAQVDNNGEGKYKDYKSLQDCIDKNIADDPKHDPVAAKRGCIALGENDLSKEGSIRSASVNEEIPAGMYQFGASLYGIPIDREENNLKSASTGENEGTLIGTGYYGKNRPSNTIVRVVN